MTEAEAPKPRLSIIIPAYNESRRLPLALEQIRQYLRASGLTAEVLVVDDGSADGTAEKVEAFDAGDMPLRLLRNDGNRGKGYSVRRGMLEADGQLLLMTDADQSTPLYEIEKLFPFVEDGCDVVIGSRDLPDSEIVAQPLMRRFMGRALRWLRGRLMLADISDTQCGFKLFTRRAARAIFQRARTNGFAFDCEALLLARKLGYRVKEVGVVWCNDPDSRVRPVRDSCRMLASLVAIRWRLRGVETLPAAQTPPAPQPAPVATEPEATKAE